MKKFIRKIRKRNSKKKHSGRIKNSGVNALKDLSLALGELGLEFWLEFGTLLGAIREGGFIGHDADIDIGVKFDAGVADDMVIKAMELNGFTLKSYFKSDDKTYEQTYIHSSKVEIDLFFVYEEDNKYIVYDFVWDKTVDRHAFREEFGGSLCYENRMTKFGLKKCLFLGYEFSIPDNFDEHLSELYGEDYMVSNPEWKHSTRKIRKATNQTCMRSRV